MAGKTQTTASTNGKETKGLRKPQVRIIKALAKIKTGEALTRAKIIAAISQGEKPTAIGDALGVTDPKNRPVREKAAGFPSLLTLGLVKETHIGGKGEEVNETVYALTAAGRKAAATATI